MSNTPVTDAFREVVFAQYKEDELTGNGMGNILAALRDIETLERKRECECKCDVDWPEEYYELRQRLERERDEALAYADKLAAGLPEGMLPKDVEVLRDANLALAVERDALQEQLDAAIMLGKLQERRHERELEQFREQYRLSSVCRKLKAENEQLKQQQQ